MIGARPRCVAVATLALLVAGCSAGTDADTTATATSTSSSTSTSTTSTSTTTTSTTTTTVAPVEEEVALPGLGQGDSGAAVLALEQRLDALHYDVGAVDGTFDKVTMYAVMAFQKVHGFGRDGRATDEIVAAMAADPGTHAALAPQGGPNRVEVDLGRQVLFLYQGGGLTRILPVSTGSDERFCSEGYCRYAVTPKGAYTVYRVASGWETGPLGDLYNPLYFNGGIAFHGAYSVPGYPASHGCVRIPMNAAEWFPTVVGNGWPMYVSGGVGDVIGVAQPEAPPEPIPTITLPSALPPA
ncbi:MAG TPA: L,D-transpeptidase family protein [Acidimicrobiales bacterium]